MSASDTQDLWFIIAWVVGALVVWGLYRALRRSMRGSSPETLAKSAGALTGAAQAKVTGIKEAFREGRKI